ncbi:mannose-6-phosphate isomerase-like protein (cupin superfamily) [Microbacterium ulmi]|uniref:Cupin domain-containing protein n=2 Tax=Microbacterium ulmi TaxID=179095 RepID=A0A7Y2M4V4_9MICO|nr:mannose-6-phosphate isomerase-like protein (cupin superfamily) [Microbacterium ulmi]NNH05133.1 cupin domain-containing protein [Microbacterium ulmi]
MLPVESPVTTETLRVGSELAAVLATTEETNGDLFAVELRMPPGGGPPVMHRHAPSEIYQVLSGEFTFYITGDDGVTARRVARAGETVTMAGNTPHTVRNESNEDAVAFQVHAPGGPMEGFTRSAARLAADHTPTIEEVLTIAQRNGIELLGPVPHVGSA